MTEDTVNHPHHYEGVPCECILLAEQYSFNIGSMIKYVWRHDRKGHAKTDLEKAYWYCQRAQDCNESFSPCTRYRYEYVCVPSETPKPLESQYDAKTLLLLKADFTTDETEKPFWQGLADGNASAVNTALQTMIDKAER